VVFYSSGLISTKLYDILYTVWYTAISILLSPLPDNENVGRILAEAWKLFQLKGFRGVSMNAVCQACGITKPTLYYYFEDKETLYIRVMLYSLKGLRSIIEGDRPLRERLAGLASEIIATYTTNINAMLHDMQYVRRETYHTQVNEAFQRELFGPLHNAMSQGINSGDLRPGDAAIYAWVFLGLINVFIGRASGAPPDTVAEMAVGLFLRGTGQNA
jgi:AcrR family transcriptional regulator